MDIKKYNQIAWDNKVKQGKRYTIPAGQEVIKQAKAGNWQINLTPCIQVPREWFPPLKGLKCFAWLPEGKTGADFSRGRRRFHRFR